MPAIKKHDWPKLKSRFIGGEWPTLREMAKATGIHPQVVKTRAAKDKWLEERDNIIREEETRAKNRILGKLTSEFEKRLNGMLQTADVLRYKGLQTLSDEKLVLNATEAIKALVEAANIETEIFLGRNRQRSIQATEEMVPPNSPSETSTQIHEHTDTDAAEITRVLLESGALQPPAKEPDKGKT